jgi:hypothetical protein
MGGSEVVTLTREDAICAVAHFRAIEAVIGILGRGEDLSWLCEQLTEYQTHLFAAAFPEPVYSDEEADEKWASFPPRVEAEALGEEIAADILTRFGLEDTAGAYRKNAEMMREAGTLEYVSDEGPFRGLVYEADLRLVRLNEYERIRQLTGQINALRVQLQGALS